jgi:hypothetical protein
MAEVFINRIATAVPRHQVHGAFRAFAAGQAAGAQGSAAFARMDARAGIATRYSVLEPSEPEGSGTSCGFYVAGGAFPTTRTRMARYEAEAWRRRRRGSRIWWSRPARASSLRASIATWWSATACRAAWSAPWSASWAARPRSTR